MTFNPKWHDQAETFGRRPWIDPEITRRRQRDRRVGTGLLGLSVVSMVSGYSAEPVGASIFLFVASFALLGTACLCFVDASSPDA